jgi:hypothetical protein
MKGVLGKDFVVDGRPCVPGSTHDPYTVDMKNWESDNAFDWKAPEGTVVYAIEDGVICSTCSYGAGSLGHRFYLNTKDNQYYYTHLRKIYKAKGERACLKPRGPALTRL